MLFPNVVFASCKRLPVVLWFESVLNPCQDSKNIREPIRKKLKKPLAAVFSLYVSRVFLSTYGLPSTHFLSGWLSFLFYSITKPSSLFSVQPALQQSGTDFNFSFFEEISGVVSSSACQYIPYMAVSRTILGAELRKRICFSFGAPRTLPAVASTTCNHYFQ